MTTKHGHMVAIALGMLLSAEIFVNPLQDGRKNKGSHSMTYTFPQGTINSMRGDYIARRAKNNKWTVFLVEDIVLLSRLVPLRFPRGVELAEEKDTIDSARPAYLGEIKLLLTAYHREFATAEEASRSIKEGSLGSGSAHLCLDVREFPSERSVVYEAPSR